MASDVSLSRVYAFLIGSAVAALGAIFGLGVLFRQFPTPSGHPWRGPYRFAFGIGAVHGAVVGMALPGVFPAVTGRLPLPLKVLAFPVSGTAGGLLLGMVFHVACGPGAWGLVACSAGEDICCVQ